jgi:hypothetical protein
MFGPQHKGRPVELPGSRGWNRRDREFERLRQLIAERQTQGSSGEGLIALPGHRNLVNEGNAIVGHCPVEQGLGDKVERKHSGRPRGRRLGNLPMGIDPAGNLTLFSRGDRPIDRGGGITEVGFPGQGTRKELIWVVHVIFSSFQAGSEAEAEFRNGRARRMPAISNSKARSLQARGSVSTATREPPGDSPVCWAEGPVAWLP